MIDIPLKRCSKCKLSKPLSEFPKNRSKKDGLGTECHECNRLRMRIWAKNNPDKHAEGKHRYIRNNPERRKQSIRDYCLSHREQIRQHSRENYRANIEENRKKGRERGRRDYWKYRDKALARHRAKYIPKPRVKIFRHPGYYKAIRRARKRNLPHTWNTDEWKRALVYFDYRCAACGRPQGLWHTLSADHWIPLASPNCPGTIAENMIPLCHGNGGCNNAKYNKDPIEWLDEHFGKRKAQAILKRIQAYFEWVKKQKT